MERVDIVVTGLDPARPRAEVIAALAQRLARSADELALLLEVAPSPLVRAVSSEDADRLLAELRALGVRVKLRAEVRDGVMAVDAAPPPFDEIVPLPSKYDRDDEEASAPSASEIAPDPVTPPVPIIVHTAHEWFQPTVAAPPPTIPDAPAPPLAPPAPAPARFGRSSAAPRSPRARARVFFRDLPDAFLLPIRGPLLRAQALAPIFACLALVTAGLGLRSETTVGAFLVTLAVMASIGYVSLVHQLASSCHAAALASDAIAAPLPGRLMDDYLRPGALATALLAGAASLALTLGAQLERLRATTLTMTLFWGAITIYGTLAFALAAASQSVLGYFDAVRMAKLVVRAPLSVLVVLTMGGLPLAAAVYALSWTLAASLAETSLGSFVRDVAVLGPAAAIALSYAASFVGGATGLVVSSARIDE